MFNKHKYDFEGRCEECGRGLDLILTRIPSNSLRLEPAECPEHKDKAMILWPQRDDIKEILPEKVLNA